MDIVRNDVDTLLSDDSSFSSRCNAVDRLALICNGKELSTRKLKENEIPVIELLKSDPAILDALLKLLLTCEEESAGYTRLQACRLISLLLQNVDANYNWMWDIISKHIENVSTIRDSNENESVTEEKEKELPVEARVELDSPPKGEARNSIPSIKSKASIAQSKSMMLENLYTNVVRLKERKHFQSRQGVGGVLLGRSRRNCIIDSTAPERIGYIVPMMWYPGSQMNRLPPILKQGEEENQRKYARSLLGRKRQRHLISSFNREEASMDDIEKEETKSEKIEMFSKADQNEPEDVIFNKALVTISEKLDRVLQDEVSIGKRLKKEISDHRLSFPIQFLMEKGMEISWCRKIIREFLSIFFECVGRVPLRNAFEKWGSFASAGRFSDLVQRAGFEKIRMVVSTMLHLQKRKAWNTWHMYLRLLEESKRLAAVIVFQKVRRGILDRRFFEIHRRRWYASRKIQTCFRRWTQVKIYIHVYNTIIFIQKYARKWAVEEMIRNWKKAAVLIQKNERMRTKYLSFKILKKASIRIQYNYRGLLGRRRFQVEFNKAMVRLQMAWFKSTLIQKAWRQYTARIKLWKIKREEDRIIEGALTIQRFWYTIQEQFPGYVLMRALLVEDERNELVERNEKRAERRSFVVVIQAFLRKKYARRKLVRLKLEYWGATVIQRIARGVVTRARVLRYKKTISFAVCIQRFVRTSLAPRNNYARSIQRIWWLYSKGALTKRLRRLNGEKRQKSYLHALYLKNVAATCIQCLYRQRVARRELAVRAANFYIQRIVRGYLGYLKSKRVYRDRIKLESSRFVKKIITDTYMKCCYTIFQTQKQSACKIQSFFRGIHSRYYFKVLKHEFVTKVKAARVIQCSFRVYNSWKCTKHIRKHKQKRSQNRYKSLDSVSEVSFNAILHARTFFDPFDDFSGMHLSCFLRRIHQTSYYELLNRQRINDLYKLMNVNADTLKRIGITNESDIEAFLSVLRVVRNTDKQVREKRIIIKLDEDDSNMKHMFGLIRNKKELLDLYMKYYPDQTLRATNFTEKMPLNEVSRIQLIGHFEKYKGRPKEAKDYANEELLHVEKSVLEMQRVWDIKRMQKCFLIYEMAVERIRDIIKGPDWLISVINQTLRRSKLFGIFQQRRGCCELRTCLNTCIRAAAASVQIQKMVRCKLSQQSFLKILMAKRYYEEINEGSLLKKKWNEEKAAQRLEWEKYYEECARFEREEYLSTISRYGWEDVWDEASQAYYFANTFDETMMSWERVVYTYEEDRMAIRIQRCIRVFLAKLTLLRRQEEKRIQEELHREQKAWEALQYERDNMVTFRFKVICSEDRSKDIPFGSKKSIEDVIELGASLTWRQSWLPIVSSDSKAVSIADVRSDTQKDIKGLVDSLDGLNQNLEDNQLRLRSLLEKRQRGRDSVAQDMWFRWIQANKSIDVSKYNSSTRLSLLAQSYIPVETDSSIHEGFGNWRSAKDPKGKVYYFDTEEGTTCWDTPAEIMEELARRDKEREVVSRNMMIEEDKEAVEWAFEHVGMINEDILARRYKIQEIENSSFSHLATFKNRKEIEEGEKLHWKVEKAIGTEALSARKIQALMRGVFCRQIKYEESLRDKITKLECDIEHLEGKINKTEHYLSSLFVGAHMSAKFTMVDMPYGWSTHKDGYGRYFYNNEFTGETVWKKPVFVWQDELSARNLQRVYRGRVGRRMFEEYLRNLHIKDIAETGLETANSMAWIGRVGLGLTVEMWFARHGLDDVLKEIAEIKANKIKTLRRLWENQLENPEVVWTEATLKKIHVVDKQHVGRVIKIQNLLTSMKENDEKPMEGNSWLDFVRNPDVPASMFLENYSNQKARSIRFAQQIKLSKTPVTFLQIKLHLEKYKGKPSLACVQVETELGNRPTISTPGECKQARLRLNAALNRVCIVLSNLKIKSLQEVLQKQLDLSNSIPERVNGNAESFAPGPFYCSPETPIEAARALILSEGNEMVIQAVKGATMLQTLYRNYTNLMAWRKIAKWYRDSCIMIQCSWRCYSARKKLQQRYAMFHSPWEELYDENAKLFYYFDNDNNLSQWEKPSVPYRPHKWWPPDPNEIPPDPGMCSKCRTEEAIKGCYECVYKTGDNREFCFQCFAIVHSANKDMSIHGFYTIGAEEGNKLIPCIKCDGPSLRRCNDCQESFCTNCYRRFHNKGKRKDHTWTIYEDNVLLCIECEQDMATLTCEDCKDVYCEKCSKRIHGKGKRARHRIEKIPLTVKKEGQGL